MIVLRDGKSGIVVSEPQGCATDSKVLRRNKKKKTPKELLSRKVCHDHSWISLVLAGEL